MQISCTKYGRSNPESGRWSCLACFYLFAGSLTLPSSTVSFPVDPLPTSESSVPVIAVPDDTFEPSPAVPEVTFNPPPPPQVVEEVSYPGSVPAVFDPEPNPPVVFDPEPNPPVIFDPEPNPPAFNTPAPVQDYVPAVPATIPPNKQTSIQVLKITILHLDKKVFNISIVFIRIKRLLADHSNLLTRNLSLHVLQQ